MSILTEKISIKIDGDTYKEYDFSDVQLVQELQGPNEFRFLMRKKRLLEDENDIRFSFSEKLLGKSVEFSLNTFRADSKEEKDTLEFSGIIFNVNVLRGNLKAGAVIEVTAYSPDYFLLDNSHCFSYEKLTLKDIVSKTLDPYDIKIENDPGFTEEIPYTVQYNETNYGFLRRLACRFGEWLYYTGDKLVFGKIIKLDSVDLYVGRDVLDYRYRLNMEHLNFKHVHHNYLNYENTQKSGYDSSDPAMHNLTDIAYDVSKDLYKKESFQHLNASNPEDGFDETEISAKIQGLGKKAQMMVCHGNSNRADMRIGSVIKLKEDFEDENGNKKTCDHDELLICSVSHYVDNMGNYENQFTGIPSHCEVPPYTYGDFTPRAEPQRAVVKDNQDPEKLGRVRVQFLWQKEQDEEMMTPWIRIAQPHGGNNKGFYFIPEIDEEVMVGFENGNAEKPYVTGTLYQGEQKPGENWYTDENEVKAIRTKNGHTIEIHDEGDDGYIRIYDNEKENYILTFSTDDKLIKLESTGNIELYAEKDIILKAKNDIALQADNHIYREADKNINDLAHKNFYLTAENEMHTVAKSNYLMGVDGNYECEVKGNQTIDVKSDMATTVTGAAEIAATGDFTAKGMNVSVEGNINTEIKAGASMKVAGSATGEFDGGASTTIKGGMIQIG